jgi:S-DNA-T family DNA segregation ATPase FtsK/SpoIIIE
MLPSERVAQAANLLSSYPPGVQIQAGKISRKLMSLGFASLFTKAINGPVVRSFTFTPIGDVRFSSILSKGEELAGSLAVESVRIERELGALVISVPQEHREIIHFDACLHRLLTSTETKSMALPLLMGQSKTGEYLYADLADQPHMLIAGATNSGKSVFTAQLICSLALLRSEAELEFTLVDTKKLDLVLFKTLPHVRRVLSTVEDIRATLGKLLEEIRLRNSKMSGLVRNIREWNVLNKKVSFPERYSDFQQGSMFASAMKYKVLIMDELADVVDQDEEELRKYTKRDRPTSILEYLKTIAQISRASGVHLILATQRPSVDILPGSIKTNFLARIAFKLPTRTDSQVILDENGAENLLGAGDYLYKISSSDQVKRAHGSYVSTTDIATIIAQREEIRRQYELL